MSVESERMVELMAERPGFMLYFDMAEPLMVLKDEEKGRLLDAMFNYGQFGVIPEFDGYLKVAWGFIRPKLDTDARNYRKRVVKNTYSSYCARERKKENTIPMDLEEWCEKEGVDTSEWTQAVSTDTKRYPTTAPKTESSPKANTVAEAKAEGGGKGEEDEDFESLRLKKMEMLREMR